MIATRKNLPILRSNRVTTVPAIGLHRNLKWKVGHNKYRLEHKMYLDRKEVHRKEIFSDERREVVVIKSILTMDHKN